MRYDNEAYQDGLPITPEEENEPQWVRRVMFYLVCTAVIASPYALEWWQDRTIRSIPSGVTLRVCEEGCRWNTIQPAIDAVAGRHVPAVILIEPGLYEEAVTLGGSDISLIGTHDAIVAPPCGKTAMTIPDGAQRLAVEGMTLVARECF